MTTFAASPGAIGAAAERADWRRARAMYLRPEGIVTGAAAQGAISANAALPLAGGPRAFTLVDVIFRTGAGRESILAPVAALREWAESTGGEAAAAVEAGLERLSRARAPFAGLDLNAGADGALLMGVVNVTPDSFSDGGDRADARAAIDGGLALREAGADIIDVGGESTRPGAEPVPVDEEIGRVLPVVKGLAERGVPVSIDTRHARVMDEALDAGAVIVNDVTALAGDAESLPLVARRGAPAILMHMQGEPRTMQDAPSYVDAALDVFDFLEARVAACEAAGIGRASLVVDPGIGFGKTARHNAEILTQLGLYQGLGCGVALGVSRKRFVAGMSRGEPPKARFPGSLAAGLAALAQGVQILRVHDVAETRQAVSVWAALAAGA